MWLSRTRTTLDQYGVQADAMLNFTPMHKTLRVQLPDLRYIDARVDFSVKTFNAVVQLCKDLGMRHPEELSLMRPLVGDHLKRNYRNIGVSPRQRSSDIAMGPIVQTSPHGNLISTPDGKAGTYDDRRSPSWNGTGRGNYSNGHSYPSPEANGNALFGIDQSSLAVSPVTPTLDAKNALLRPKSLVERARLNAGWLDSSLSLYEQDVREFDLLLLRYKFYSFYDLNPKTDAARINQIYEQAKWAILTEEIDCTEEEMLMFAALQLQVNLQANNPLPERQMSRNDDDIDAALNELQITLEGSAVVNTSMGDTLTHVPELADYLRFMKPKRFTLKSFRRYYFVFKDTFLSLYKSREERHGSEPALRINLRGCEVT